MTAHTTTLVKFSRGPHVDPHWRPVCETCGPIAPPTDRDDAKRAGRQHEEQVAVDALAAEVSG